MAAESALYEINVDRFWQRLALLHGHWLRHVENFSKKVNPNPYPGWNGCQSILILCGKSDDAGYKRNNSIHIWLFGYELLSTIIIITKDTLYISCGSKTSQTLQQLQPEQSKNLLKIQIITKNKADGYAANFESLRGILSDSGKRVGLIREEMKGFAEKFQTSVDEHFEFASFSEALSDVMMLKDKFETSTMRKVSELTSQALKYFQKTMEKLIEKGKTKTHAEISNDLLKILETPKLVKSNLKNENLDVCYDPIIQSGGEYKLKPSAESNEKSLHYDYGTIVIMMGFRLRDYCSNIARTFLIDASSEQKEIYNILVTVFKKGLLMLRDNVELSKVYEKCMATIRKSKRPELEKNFLKSVGWGIGLEFRDKNYIIKRNSKRQCKAGMIFNFQVGFEGLTDAKKAARGMTQAKDYAIIIADTVLVTDDQPEFLTKFNRKFLEYELNGDIDDDAQKSSKKRKRSKSASKSRSPSKRSPKKSPGGVEDAYLPADDQPYRRVTRQSNRRSAAEQKEQMKARKERGKKQAKLRNERKKRLEDLVDETGGDIGGQQKANQWVDPKIFTDSADLPLSLKQSKLQVCLSHECLVCPIMDHMVPFHITVIKNFSISTTPDGTYLRINFVCPVSVNSNRTPKQPELFLKHPNSHFIKELTYRNDDGGDNLQFCYQQLKELQKQFKNKKKNKMLNKTMTKQDRLQRAPSSRILTLKELSVRPNMGGRKRGAGRLECHQNGFKYADHKKNEVYVLFNNIKNAFFQKSKNTPSVIIHFHLRNAIMIGKKPSEHVQVYRDVIERFEELGRNRRYDHDGMRAEQEEQKRIKRCNAQFKGFCDKVEEVAKENGFELSFDKPAMDLVFVGVPNKQSTNIYPTENCLVSLEDSPAFVIDSHDVEIAHFERVNYSLRNFDLVFVYKDFLKEPKRITTIPRENLDTLQDFLNWKGVLYSTGKINLDWKTLMGKIRTNLSGFVDSGGWDFLLEQDENRMVQDGEHVEQGPAEDEYVPESEGSYGSDDYSDEDEDEEMGSGDYSDEEDDDFEDEAEEEGLDWDELDRRAALEDKKSSQRDTASPSRKERMSARNTQYRANNRVSPTGNNKRRRY